MDKNGRCSRSSCFCSGFQCLVSKQWNIYFFLTSHLNTGMLGTKHVLLLRFCSRAAVTVLSDVATSQPIPGFISSAGYRARSEDVTCGNAGSMRNGLSCLMQHTGKLKLSPHIPCYATQCPPANSAGLIETRRRERQISPQGRHLVTASMNLLIVAR